MCFVSSDFRFFSCSQQYEEKIASLLTPQYIKVSALVGRDFLLPVNDGKELKTQPGNIRVESLNRVRRPIQLN